MWSSNQNNQSIRRYSIKLVGISFFVLFLAGCSSTNIRQLGQDNQEQLQRVALVDVDTRLGQLYGRELRKLLHFGGHSAKAYELESTITTSSSSTLAVQGASSSFNLKSMNISVVLTDLNSKKTLFKDSVNGEATFGIVTSFYGQDKSETHAGERLAILLAQRVVRRLQLYFLTQNQ